MPARLRHTAPKINTLNEKPLHAALKAWYARPNDGIEVPLDGYLIDIVRGGLLIEIQTRNFAAIKRKLATLSVLHRVRLVYPIAREKWLVKVGDDGTPIGRRKSPKRGAIIHVFDELVRLPKLLLNPNFSVEVLLIQEEEVRRYDGVRGWRRKGWVTQERRLLDVVEQRLFETPADLGAFVPAGLAEPFSTAELAAAASTPVWLARKMAYCLREMGVVESVGKRANAILYARTG